MYSYLGRHFLQYYLFVLLTPFGRNRFDHSCNMFQNVWSTFLQHVTFWRRPCGLCKIAAHHFLMWRDSGTFPPVQYAAHRPTLSAGIYCKLFLVWWGKRERKKETPWVRACVASEADFQFRPSSLHIPLSRHPGVLYAYSKYHR